MSGDPELFQLSTSRCAATTTACPSIRNLAATGDLRMTVVQGLCKTSLIQKKYKQPSLGAEGILCQLLIYFTTKTENLARLAMLAMLAMLTMLFTRIITGSARRTLCAFTGKASVGVN